MDKSPDLLQTGGVRFFGIRNTVCLRIKGDAEFRRPPSEFLSKPRPYDVQILLPFSKSLPPS